MALSNEFIITLLSIKGVGPAKINKIHNASEGNNIFSLEDLHALTLDTIGSKTPPTYDDMVLANLEAKQIITKSKEFGIGIVSKFDSEFPKKLFTTVNENGNSAVPLILYYKGNLSITSKPALAIIGTRDPTPEGVHAAKHFAGAFASIGVNIVSGLALGCDSAGHRGALDAGGATTAFLANGLDSIYPKENEKLAEEIVNKGGLLLSEYPIGTGTTKYNLVARDRLQAGLANATLVIQTGIKGGTMHAVKATLLSKKPLLVIDYAKDLGDKISGNIYLKKKENGGAIGLSYISKDSFIANKQRYLGMLSLPSEEENRLVQGTLF